MTALDKGGRRFGRGSQKREAGWVLFGFGESGGGESGGAMNLENADQTCIQDRHPLHIPPHKHYLKGVQVVIGLLSFEIKKEICSLHILL